MHTLIVAACLEKNEIKPPTERASFISQLCKADVTVLKTVK